MTSNLIAYAERAAPRYTSYPTAPHFSSAVGSEAFGAWLGELAPEAALSLYIHVPYCRELCWYCGCNTAAVRRDELLVSYVEMLGREAALVAAATSARRVREIHWGGGTPNILSPVQFERAMARLFASFDLSGVTAHAVEVDPRAMTPALAAAYARAGVNRASLGVQDLNGNVQAAIGRVQPLEVVQAAIAMLRTAGVAEISIDLMYGLPHQSVADVEASARLAASLAPQRLSLFGYAHVPWFKKRQRLIDATALPGARERVAQAEAARRTLLELGFAAVGMDHFARAEDALASAAANGTLRRNFQGYVTRAADALVGLGPSAISTLPQGYAQNASEVGAWRRAIAAGRFATMRGHALTEEDRQRAAIIERLMCDFAVDLDAFGGAARYEKEISFLAPLVADGLAAIEGAWVRIPQAAQPYCRLIAQAFDAYAMARHSMAV